VAPALRDTSVAEIERRLDALRDGGLATQRTSVLTHTAWVPPEWSRAVERVMHGLGPRVPSRTILLHPDPGAKGARLDADIAQECFPGSGRDVCAEVVRIWLRGATAKAPASVVVPLQIPDLPAFLRWRGRPDFRSGVFEQLVGVSDRLIVDSSEWGGSLPAAYRKLERFFGRIAVSDLAWARSLPFRAGIAELWPGVKEAKTLQIRGPKADALLLRGWLRSRLRRDVRLRHEEARGLRVEVDGEPVRVRRRHVLSGADMLSAELEVYERDRVYEAAVRAV
jgi:glucose-6-phosphate dehydrogenase assembly protein OpcA